MAKRLSVVSLLAAFVWMQGGYVRAQGAPPPPPPPPVPPAAEVPPPPPSVPSAADTPPALPMAPLTTTAQEPPAPMAVEASGAAPAELTQFGAALRTRWVSAPGWFLGLFTKKNVPLSSWGAGAEFFRRKGEMDIVLGFSYQKMGPPDGNWLGKGHDANIDTDLVQFRNFGFVGTDIAFLWHQRFNDYFGMHYGAGLGLAFITGEILRTSADHCTEANAGDRSQCFPDGPAHICTGSSCTEDALAKSSGEVDNGPSSPHRFKDSDVPGAIPILNMVFGLNLRFPELKGFEARIEGGFYNAFFAGLGIGYVF